MFLLDTNIVSELRRVRPHGRVVAWLRNVPADQLRLSAVTLGELQVGVEKTREQDPEKAEVLERWIGSVEQSWGVLPMSGDAFRIWARLMHRRPRNLMEDAMIAATALTHGLTVVTRNVRDFEPFGVALLNPFEPAGQSERH